MLKWLHEDHRVPEPQAREQEAMGRQRQDLLVLGGTTSPSTFRESHCHGKADSFIGKTLVAPRMQFCLAVFPQGIL